MFIKKIISIFENSYLRKIEKLEAQLDLSLLILKKHLKTYPHLFKPNIIIDNMNEEEVKESMDTIKRLETEQGKSLKYSELTEDELSKWANHTEIVTFIKNNN